ncbi:acyl-CoA carboxylase epsilon subunit [Streptomyces sp. DH24]|uniref:acyl-CoA carboxylase epsilon subunit n=1 Tax=Streptomyces sp. DH24 TaxID=3040123 RepID=UPI0024434718|nr:acyl-CoA carboxylase epsilon subunit [Streptomyces sp. DH24]MDG9721003.1 acyl-CoA carboxylase epsilon subunit [Streptomyces sp. DH24]
MEGAEAVLRVERGQAGEEELAALTAVLLALRAGGRAEPEQPPTTLGWSWWKRPEHYEPPRSWR